MSAVRISGLVVALIALMAAGALAAVILLSTIGGGPSDDPVGRLRPVMPGLDLTAVTPTDSVETSTAPDEGTTTGEDVDRDRSDEQEDD